jgi:hypothetical protein
MELVCDLGDDFGADRSWNLNWILARLGLAAFTAPLHLHVYL